MAEIKKKTIKKPSISLAVIETGGKQYLVKPGDKIKVEKIEKPKRGNVVNFDKALLLVKGAVVEIGTPFLSGVKIKGEWQAEKRAKKITNVRYKSKTRRSRKKGHRQIYTEVIIADF
ncbi:MAG: 50S ribosomal protein L21 [Candidatus Tagabacteria bacterium CG09_land_8_20_14_0_10_41_14]|uniref:Large ribosomal subunit protein bL21 n=2 Tax=Candidatus Tagaibacteriota TaxID=1817918 RepID=A0A2H0WM62_9BACT|nr:MAG: 50S ribosomal protein L21 [Candidatus Tagabacteria bacterium CG09_land_8_20_14_0_10_41_14]PJE73181.1 MAG: 50S ribosomal protein L21 [Candidatus Tagabacteria bacterium CG10_big_fil_rev_8_21_14_0_10_40_13]